MSKNSIEEPDVGFSLKGKVYFIFQQGDDKRCKIGKSVNPSNRKDQLQTGNPDELYVYKTLVGYSSLESTLHKKFKEKRIRNTEWFYLTKEEVDMVIQEYTPVEKSEQTAKRIVLNNTFTCEMCNNKFSNKQNLNKHQKTYHALQDNSQLIKLILDVDKQHNYRMQLLLEQNKQLVDILEQKHKRSVVRSNNLTTNQTVNNV